VTRQGYRSRSETRAPSVGDNGRVPRYPDYASLPEHIRAMLRAVTSDDAAAERYAESHNKNLKGRSVLQVVNAPFGQRVVEHFLLDLGNYLGVEDMDRFEADFGKKK
jgi:hypothetical protein